MRIEFLDCTFRYQHFITEREYALKNIDLVVEPSQILGLVGPNGSGKSTLLHLLVNREKPIAGTIVIDGQDLFQSKGKWAFFQQFIALVPQFPEAQFFALTVQEELWYGLAEQGLSEEVINQRIYKCFEDLTLSKDEILTRNPFTLGNCEKRLLSLAIALIREPSILLLDEPTAGLDMASSRRVWKILQRLSQSWPITMIIASHDIDSLISLTTHMAMMDNGKITAYGRLQDLFANPEFLASTGNSVPAITALGYELQKEGACFDHWPIFTLEEAEEAIRGWLLMKT